MYGPRNAARRSLNFDVRTFMSLVTTASWRPKRDHVIELKVLYVTLCWPINCNARSLDQIKMRLSLTSSGLANSTGQFQWLHSFAARIEIFNCVESKWNLVAPGMFQVEREQCNRKP